MRSSLVLKTVLTVICTWTAATVAQEPSPQTFVSTGRKVVDSQLGKAQPAVVQKKANAVLDCKLQRGSLVGAMRFATGQPATNSRLQLLNKRGEVRTASTDARGNFVFGRVPAGLYALHAEGTRSQFLRVWTDEMAPPSAKQKLLVVCDRHIVRGQCCDSPAAADCSSCGECADCCDGGCGGLGMSPHVGIGNMLQVALDNPWFVAAGTAAAIAVPLATTDDDERLGDTTDAVANGENGEDAS